MLPRCFLALLIPPEVALDCQPLCRGVPLVKWHPPANLHLTLKYLGDCELGFLDSLAAGLNRLQAPQFHCRIQGVGWFGSGGRVNNLHLRVQRSAILQDTQSLVEQCCVSHGAARGGQKFTPHITLGWVKRARQRQVQPWLLEHQFFALPAFTCTRIVLYSSHHSEQGRLYRAEAEFPLVLRSLSP